LLELPQLKSTPLDGSEPFKLSAAPTDFSVLDFWRWSVSDLVSNATRGRLAEFIVAKALGVPTSGVRDEWAAYDLLTPAGIRVEVKSAAYLQSWAQRRHSNIVFSVRRARAWDPETNLQAAVASRSADVYVFALLAHRDKASLDPLDLEQWEFYVVPTHALDARTRSQHSITLSSLRRLEAGPVSFGQLEETVAGSVKEPRPPA
jgi:hypothetical protein